MSRRSSRDYELISPGKNHHVTRWPAENYGPPLEWDESQRLEHLPQHIRSAFVRKVYLVLTLQALLSALVACTLLIYVDEAWLREHIMLYRIAAICCVHLLLVSVCCCEATLRVFPANYSFLAASAVLVGICIGFASVMHSSPCLTISVVISAAIFMGLASYACVTGTDLTGSGAYLFAGGLGLATMGISIFLPIRWSRPQRLYGGVGAMGFCFTILCDTQLLLDGRNHIGADDYAFAALSLGIFNASSDLLTSICQLVRSCGREPQTLETQPRV